MKKQTIIITGGNAGIGKAIAIKLAKQNHHVVIISRNEAKGKAALEEIKTLSKNTETELIIGNLSSIKTTKELALEISDKFPKTSILINNAGVWPTKPEINPDGLEMTFMVNHMAPFILSNMLLEVLKQNAPSRIINVNAKLYVYGKIDLERTPYGKDFGKLSTYMNSKLCNIYFTQKFAEIIEGSGVTINANHPGVIRTNLGIDSGILGNFVKSMKWFLPSAEKGAEPPVWLATNPDLEKTNGKYFELFTQKPYTKNACDPKLREKLWEMSKFLAKL
jgi:NAD(P)-dependent dehydrogenase (short-subunit alcohol dehydrogenase family)